MNEDLEKKIITIELFSEEDLGKVLSTNFSLDHIENMAYEITISNKSSAKQAVSMALQTRKIRKAISEKKDELLKPLKDIQKNVSNHTTSLIERLESIEDTLTDKLEEWIEIQNENPFDHIEKIDTEDGTMNYKYDFDLIIQPIELCYLLFFHIYKLSLQIAQTLHYLNLDYLFLYAFLYINTIYKK